MTTGQRKWGDIFSHDRQPVCHPESQSRLAKNISRKAIQPAWCISHKESKR